jgi:hypothetical protein
MRRGRPPDALGEVLIQAFNIMMVVRLTSRLVDEVHRHRGASSPAAASS